MSGHRISISAGTTWHSSYTEDLELYREAGADGIGLWEWKLPEGQDPESVRLLRGSGLAATVCFPAVASVLPTLLWPAPADLDERVEAMCRHVERLARFEPDCVAVLAGRPGDRTAAEARRLVVHGLRRVAAAAGRVGVRLVFETVRPGDGVLFSSIEDTARLIDDVGADNLGILADAWHLWDQPALREAIQAHRDRIWAVQLGDAHRPIRSFADRVLPGDGGIDLVAFLSLLKEAGYDGWYDIELLSDDGTLGNAFPDSLWKRDPRELTKEAATRFRALLEGRTSRV